MTAAIRQRSPEDWRCQTEAVLGYLASPAYRAVHFVGIGGVGMAGLAHLMHEAGFEVTGCDLLEGPTTQWLSDQGIPIQIGHEADHLRGPASWVVRSPAVPLHHPELVEAAAQQMPVIDRGALLPAWMHRYARSIAVGGTHGKTTTACMILHILETLGVESAYAIGGLPAGHSGVAGGGGLDVLVAEADESDGSLVLYAPTVAVITHTELDHIDYYPTEADLHQVYRTVISQARVASVIPVEAAKDLASPGSDVRTFGLTESADYRAIQVEQDGGQGMRFSWDQDCAPPLSVSVSAGGKHNVLNALAALAAVDALGLDRGKAASALASFRLPGRRFDVVLEAKGITVVSDYAHHPTEIHALLEQARQWGARRILGVFQPHRYSRTRQFAREFAGALRGLDGIGLVPVYSASEPFADGGRSEDLYATMRSLGIHHVVLYDSLPDAWKAIRADLVEGDLLLVIGAGDVEKIAVWAAEELG